MGLVFSRLMFLRNPTSAPSLSWRVMIKRFSSSVWGLGGISCRVVVFDNDLIPIMLGRRDRAV